MAEDSMGGNLTLSKAGPSLLLELEDIALAGKAMEDKIEKASPSLASCSFERLMEFKKTFSFGGISNHTLSKPP